MALSSPTRYDRQQCSNPRAADRRRVAGAAREVGAPIGSELLPGPGGTLTEPPAAGSCEFYRSVEGR